MGESTHMFRSVALYVGGMIVATTLARRAWEEPARGERRRQALATLDIPPERNRSEVGEPKYLADERAAWSARKIQ
jgi:hypothetical protein